MTPRINGTLAPIAQDVEINYDPERGSTVQQRFESAGDNLSGTAEAFANDRIGYSFTRSQSKSVLVATYSDNASGDSWELLANELQKDACEHPKSLRIEELWPGTLARVRRDVDLENRGEAVGSPAPDPAAVAAGAGQLAYLLLRGTTQYATSQYVLKHTTSVANTYDGNISDLNVERVYTPARLLYECLNRHLWTFPLPRRLEMKLRRLEPPQDRVGYVWGWRKLPSTETSAGQNRINITTEYWLEQWSTYLYDLAV